jgi:cation transporter-like permease
MLQQLLAGALIVTGAVILIWLLSAVIAVVLLYRRGHDPDAD